MPTCGECPTFKETVEEGGVCTDCRSGLYRKKDHPACATRLRELGMIKVLEEAEEARRTKGNYSQRIFKS